MNDEIKSVDEGIYHELLLDMFDYDGDGTVRYLQCRKLLKEAISMLTNALTENGRSLWKLQIIIVVISQQFPVILKIQCWDILIPALIFYGKEEF